MRSHITHLTAPRSQPFSTSSTLQSKHSSRGSISIPASSHRCPTASPASTKPPLPHAPSCLLLQRVSHLACPLLASSAVTRRSPSTSSFAPPRSSPRSSQQTARLQSRFFPPFWRTVTLRSSSADAGTTACRRIRRVSRPLSPQVFLSSCTACWKTVRLASSSGFSSPHSQCPSPCRCPPCPSSSARRSSSAHCSRMRTTLPSARPSRAPAAAPSLSLRIALSSPASPGCNP